MMMLTQLSGEAFAEGVNAGIDIAAKKAASLGRTQAEAIEFADTVKTAGNVAMTGLALTGLRKGVKSAMKPKVEDALSERTLVGETKVLAAVKTKPVEPRTSAPKAAPWRRT
jgi:hypothetical protein